MTTQPMQPIIIDGLGIARFQSNAIIGYLLMSGKLDLNEIARLTHFNDDDRMQIAQLLGYSVSAFGDLSYADQRVVEDADEIVAKMMVREATEEKIMPMSKIHEPTEPVFMPSEPVSMSSEPVFMPSEKCKLLLKAYATYDRIKKLYEAVLWEESAGSTARITVGRGGPSIEVPITMEEAINNTKNRVDEAKSTVLELGGEV